MSERTKRKKSVKIKSRASAIGGSEKVGQTFSGVHIAARRAASLKMLFKKLIRFFQGQAVRCPAMRKGVKDREKGKVTCIAHCCTI